MRRRERLNKISNILDTLDDNHKRKEDMVQKILNTWPERLVDYKYTEDLEPLWMLKDNKNARYGKERGYVGRGLFIQYVSLDLKKIGGGALVNFKHDCNGLISKIILKNTSKNVIFQIDPCRYYIFYKVRENISDRKVKLEEQRDEERWLINKQLCEKANVDYDEKIYKK